MTALYPSIPHEDGLSALASFLADRNFNPSVIQGIVSLARLVLTRNFFEFNNSLYLQKSGTAIGTVMAVRYAIVFMHQSETMAMASFMLKPSIWWRYIDDVFCVWTHGEESLLQLEHLNFLNRSITFSVDYSPTSVHFLDVIVNVDPQGVLSTDLHVKPTDTHQFLLS